jgi:hypothetical protein
MVAIASADHVDIYADKFGYALPRAISRQSLNPEARGERQERAITEGQPGLARRRHKHAGGKDEPFLNHSRAASRAPFREKVVDRRI